MGSIEPMLLQGGLQTLNSSRAVKCPVFVCETGPDQDETVSTIGGSQHGCRA